jgi:hypothetical protein
MPGLPQAMTSIRRRGPHGDRINGKMQTLVNWDTFSGRTDGVGSRSWNLQWENVLNSAPLQ